MLPEHKVREINHIDFSTEPESSFYRLVGKRFLDICFSFMGMIVLIPLFVLIALLIKLESEGPVIFKQRRIGIHNNEFTIYKFRTMRTGTPDLASHLIDPRDYVTRIGGFLRKTSLDELPQLLNILKGELSLVGPRPALYNQDDLIEMRTQKGVHLLKPGLTGLAQINGRDDISNEEKVKYDALYAENLSFATDVKILLATLVKVVKGESVRG